MTMRMFSAIAPVILALCLFCSEAFSRVQINGKITLQSEATISFPRMVVLGGYRGSELVSVDSVPLRYDMTFSLNVRKEIKDGVYELNIGKEISVPMVLTSGDTLADLNLGWNGKTVEMALFNFENQAFYVFNKIQGSFTTRKIQAQRMIAVPQEPGRQERILDSLKLAFNDDFEKFRRLYKGSYAAEILTKIMLIPHRAYFDSQSASYHSTSYLSQHFLDSIPFRDERVLNNPQIDEKLESFLFTYTHQGVEGMKTAVDALVNKASANAKVKDHVVNQLLTVFLFQGGEEVVTYISDNYIAGCASGLPEITMKRVGQFKNFSEGTKVPDVESVTPGGKKISLYSLLGDKPVMVYFWSSTCSHCKEDTPRYLDIYKAYKDRGFKVFAVSLDTEKESWKNEVERSRLDWINVSDLKGYNSETAQTFFVYRTPTVFLLDKDGKIISKSDSPEKLKAELDNFMKQ